MHQEASPPEVEFLLDGERHRGYFVRPPAAHGLVVFAHGSGSGRLSRRNQFVAGVLGARGLATLLFDLLTEREDMHVQNRFDLKLLTGRLLGATEWVRRQPGTATLPLGFFGASTGAAAALQAGVASNELVRAIVSRGGRPDLAEGLERVRAPTLLIVGGADDLVLDLNRAALARLQCEKELSVVAGATHLFEEPGTLDAAARLAAEWFVRHME
jgi:putative phosphoribosyl transferase